MQPTFVVYLCLYPSLFAGIHPPPRLTSSKAVLADLNIAAFVKDDVAMQRRAWEHDFYTYQTWEITCYLTAKNTG